MGATIGAGVVFLIAFAIMRSPFQETSCSSVSVAPDRGRALCVPHTWVNCIDANEAGDPQAQVHQVQLNDFLKTFFPNRVKF